MNKKQIDRCSPAKVWSNFKIGFQGIPQSILSWLSLSTILSNLVPRVSYFPTPWSERGETLAQAGHVSSSFWEMTIELLKGRAAQ